MFTKAESAQPYYLQNIYAGRELLGQTYVLELQTSAAKRRQHIAVGVSPRKGI
jgi:hypothetical protein